MGGLFVDDPDVNANYNFTVLGRDKQFFGINTNNELVVVDHINYNVIPEAYITIVAQEDATVNALSITKDFVITITDLP